MKKIKIIGAGIAGLSAGCYLQMNGFETEIFEIGWQAGGLCTAWRRKEYLIDGCIHWFVGCNPSEYLYNVWNSLVDMKKTPMAVYDQFCCVEHDGKIIRMLADAEKLNTELKNISPEDSKTIDEFTGAIKKFSSFKIYEDETGKKETLIHKIQTILKIASFIPTYLKWNMPIEKYAKKFKSPHIRNFLINSLGEDTPMWIMLFNCACFDNKDAGYPAGGAKELVNKILKRYESLGGKVHYNSRVTKIAVEGNEVRGIELENGEKFNADIVISAADGRYTVQEMLGGRFRDRYIKKLYYSGKYEPKQSGFHIALGVARKFDETAKPYVFFDVKKSMTIDGKEIKKFGVTIYNFDPTSPKNKTVLTVLIPSSNPNYWVKLREQDKQEYEKQKNEIGQYVIDELESRFGNIKNNLEMTDVATPATYVRYTNNWNGALMGWTDTRLFVHKPKKEIKGLKNFYMCGQWVGDAGLPGAAISGRNLAKIICKRDNKQFKASTF